MKRVGSTAQRLREKPYEKRVCRSENYPGCLLPKHPYEGLSVEEYVDCIHEMGLEVQIVAGEMDRGTPRFPSQLLPPHPDVARDRLPRFLELAHARGILVLTYYSTNYCKPLRPLHPEWLMKFLDDGRPEPENLGWFCFNSPYRDWLPQYLQEFLDYLDLDGFYFDDMNWGSHEDHPYWPSCCCEYCERLFREETGLNVPSRVDFASLDFRRFLNWRSDRIRVFMAHLTRQVKATYPDAILDFNYYGGVYGNWNVGHPANPLHLGEVGGYFFIERTLYDGTSLTAKMGRAHGSPCGLWIGPTQTLPECATHLAPNPEPLSPTLHFLAAMANGVRPLLAMLDGPVLFRQEPFTTVFAEARKRVDYLDGDTVKYVALHWSQQNRDFHRPSPDPYLSAAEYFKRLRGSYEILNQSHLLVDVVFDEQLTDEHLAPYKVLFLSNSSCLSDIQGEAIRRFVRAGGTLVATHETSLQDELGQRRDNFALADVLGLNYRGPAGAGAVHGILYVPHDEELTRQFGYVLCFAAEEACVELRPGALVELLCTRSSLDGPRPLDRFHLRENYDSGEPTVTVHPFGQGRAIYLSGDVGGGFSHNPYPPLKRFVAGLVHRTRPPLEVEAPKIIEVTAATRGEDTLMIHLLNNPTPFFAHSESPEHAQEVCTYFYNLEEVIPVRDLTIRLNDFRARTARMPLSGRDLELVGDPPTVVVPEVRIHEVVLFEGLSSSVMRNY